MTLTTPDGKALTKVLTIPVETNDPPGSRGPRGSTLAAGKTFRWTISVFDGLVPGSASATLAVGPLAQLDAPGLLEALDRYPYGCTEQITSKALPLLYLDEVAVAMGLAERDRLSLRIEQAITEVLTEPEFLGRLRALVPRGRAISGWMPMSPTS